MRTLRRLVVGAAVLAASAALAPAAWASINASMSLSPSSGKAGSTANLGLNLSFTNSGTDSPQNLTLNLPPGLLANANIDGGACLQHVDLTSTACQVGTGQISSDADPLGLAPIPLPTPVDVTYHLVPPPAPGDLAGLAVYSPLLSEQLGTTGDIRVRPSGDPNGVGVTIKLALPRQLPLSILPPALQLLFAGLNVAQISLTDINNTFDGLRYPATCPSPAANVTGSVDSYNDSTPRPVSAPLTVTGCSSLPFSPAFKVTATRDRGDKQLTLTTDVTQTANQAPSRAVSLSFPTSTVSPNLAAIRALCLQFNPATCPVVGSASATSPLYPSTLTGKAYLTGSRSGASLTLVFPSPFPLTLTGQVSLQTDTASFSGLPDIPLTDLNVTLNGGPNGLFMSTCRTPSGTANATLSSQNGDKTARLPAAFTVAGCPGSGSGSGGGGTGGAGGTGGGGGTGGSGGSGSTSTHVTTTSASGLATGKPSLTFRVTAGRRAPRLTRLTVALPKGLTFVRHRVHRKLRVTGVSLKGARVKSLVLSHGHLVITLRRPSRAITVRLGSPSLRESARLRAQARAKRLKSLTLRVVVRNAKHRNHTLHVRITRLHL